MAGYSGTSLAAKLGIKAGSRIALSNAPKEYLALVAPLPPDVEFVPRITSKTDIVHVFVTERRQLEKTIRALLPRLKPDGVIWVSWPKKASKVPTDITEDTIRAVVLPLGLVDVKVCAVTDVWSGLKLVIRRDNRC